MVALSNDVHMSAPKKSDPPESQGVLSNLPRTRPQRASPRRAAARKATKTATTRLASAPTNGRPAPDAQDRPTPTAPAAGKRAPKRKPPPARDPARSKRARSSAEPAAGVAEVPRQGFECEGERASGSVQPPGGTELVASAAEIIGELAKVGFSTGERLLKDVLSRLPLS